MKNMLPLVVTMIKYYLVCPASTANAERSFSHLRRLKTYLRSTMTQARLNSLLILSTYKEVQWNLYKWGLYKWGTSISGAILCHLCSLSF